jgi:hypothetical protein
MMLSRYEITPDGSVKKGFCGPFFPGSADSYIFQTPLPRIGFLIENTDFYVGGVLGGENLFGYRACSAGIMVTNPCGSIRSFHNHNSNIRTYDESIRLNRVENLFAYPINSLRNPFAGECWQIYQRNRC